MATDTFLSGVTIWKEKALDDMDYVLLLPHEDEHLNNPLRNSFTRKLNGRAGIIIEGRDADALIELYALYAFTGKIIIGSYCQPHGRKLYNLLNSGIATEEVLINDVILGVM